MDNLSSKLSEILNDEESMKKVKALAEGLLSDGVSEEKNNNSSESTGLSANELNSVISIINRLKSSGDDRRTALLLALKPNLSKEKQEKVDTAVKLLKLIELLPYLKESGILSIF